MDGANRARREPARHRAEVHLAIQDGDFKKNLEPK
jgi:hypothetical protein